MHHLNVDQHSDQRRGGCGQSGDEPSNRLAKGREIGRRTPIRVDRAQHPEANARFNAFQASRTSDLVEAVVAGYDFSGFRTVVDVGGGIRYYVWGHVFVRPEGHFYHIVNNTAEFSNNNVIRVGASIGYTIGPD